MHDEQKELVLNMIAEGKITADDGVKLLEALQPRYSQPFRKFHDRVRSEETARAFEEKIGRFSAGVEQFAKELGGKMEVAFKDMEPKMRKATKAVVEKTAKVVDDISKSLNESLKKYEEGSCCCCDELADDCECCHEEEDKKN